MQEVFLKKKTKQKLQHPKTECAFIWQFSSDETFVLQLENVSPLTIHEKSCMSAHSVHADLPSRTGIYSPNVVMQ